MFVLRPAILSLAELGEQLKVLLALVTRLEDGQIFQGLYRKEGYVRELLTEYLLPLTCMISLSKTNRR